ncbi:VOC family protein [Dactylosporangium vinaceum]|uniref:VOC family protein n=1 Tax=Dactylosporangium vinaceum TaxID=53362 RepID=A0ABV5MN11_9ACTN|nr:VOC family protein [Dactylosporangium vinaceum]UAB92332.1 VOC family protein [Dactylosporangium vinaceum]
MDFISIRLITVDVDRLAAFYATLAQTDAVRPTADFAEIRTPRGTIAIAHARTVPFLTPAPNGSVIVEFLAADVDAVFRRLTGAAPAGGPDVVQEPTTMPWGNRSLLLRDPDGNLVNVFTPVTPAAIAKFA